MTQSPNTWTSQPERAGNDARRSGAYHPECGEEHHHKPTKAMIGIGLLVVLSFLFYELNGKPTHPTAAGAIAQHQNFAANISR